LSRIPKPLLRATLLWALAVSFAAAQQNFVQPRIVQAVDDSQLTLLKGNIHPLARPQFDRGAAPANLPMDRMLLVLKRSPQQEDALRKLLDEQQDKSSANYHKWLTPEQFGKRFGPADGDIQIVVSWLSSHSFHVAPVTKGRTVIEFSGNAAQVREAFHTDIHKYVVQGKEHWANASDLQIPVALAPVVAGVHTLHNFLKKPPILISKQKIVANFVPGQAGKSPQVTFPNPPNPPFHALGPADYAKIYNINPVYQAGINGGTTTIAIVGRTDIQVQDVRDFNIAFGLGSPNVNVIPNGPDPGDLGGGEEFEAVLDTTWSGAIAPGAAIDLVVSASTNTTDGVDLSEVYIVDNNLGDVMTESFGVCEAALTSSELTGISTIAEQAAAQGITYFVSSGDSGAEGCDNPNFEAVAAGPISVNALSSTPFNIAVGGTMFNENGQPSKYWGTAAPVAETALSYIPENVWNQSCTVSQCGGENANIAAGGGGASAFFAKPAWQSGVSGIPNDGARDVPDVSLTAASHDPYLICIQFSCEQGFIFFVAGTSASAPSFAGVMALVDQKMGGRQGQANYVLYRLAAKETFSQCNGSSTTSALASTCIFNDVTVGNIAVPGEVGFGASTAKFQSGVGYDLATGLGSVNVTNLVNHWSSVTFSPTTTTLTLNSGNPVSVAHGAPVNVDIVVAPQSGTGVPSGDVALLTNAGPFGHQSVTAFTLSGGSAVSTTNLLAGGSYSITAHYAGDGTFAPSDSPAVAVNVTPESSTTSTSVLALDASGNPIPFTGRPYGSFVYLRADVAGTSGKGTATGSVNFMDSGALVAGDPYSLNSEGNTATPNGIFTFAVGSHAITAAYGGDNSFNASTSSPAVNFTVTQASSSTSVSFTGNTQGATLNANVSTSSGGNPPSGTVTFFINGSQVGTPVAVTGLPASTNFQTGAFIGAQAIASFSDTQLANGKYTLTATFTGDTNYSGSTAAATVINLQPDFVLSENNSGVNILNPGGSGTLGLSAIANDGFKGTINFSCSGLPTESKCSFSPASLTGGGSTTLTITTTAPKASMLTPLHGPQGSGILAVISGMAGFLLIGVPGRRRWNRVLLLIATGFLTAIVACGGGGGGSTASPSPSAPDPGTTTGIFNVTVTATSGTLTHSTTFFLSVQ
jgi:subtilase family serine protease